MAEFMNNTSRTELNLSSAQRTPAAPRHLRARTCVGCTARRPRRAPHVHGACAPRAADNNISDEGIKELAAGLKDNTTLLTLSLSGACSGALAHTPRPNPAAFIAARARLRVKGRARRRAARTRSPHALAPPTTRAPHVCRSQSD